MPDSATSTPSVHRVRWSVLETPGGRFIPRTSTMRGRWPGYEATCSCGWETRTGGAVRSYIERMVREHKDDVAHASSAG